MEVYEIKGVINKETKQIDEKGKRYLGKMVAFDVAVIEKGKSFTMKEENETNYIKTSPVRNCLVDGEEVYVETNNRIYKFVKTNN